MSDRFGVIGKTLSDVRQRIIVQTKVSRGKLHPSVGWASAGCDFGARLHRKLMLAFQLISGRRNAC
jgi:hypothetical protein